MSLGVLFMTRRRLIILAVLLGGTLALGLISIPAYLAFKVWRAEELAGQALDMIEEPGSLVGAWEKVRSAFYLAPENLEVARTMGKVLERVDPPQALEHWTRAFELSEGALEDRLGVVNNALLAGQPDRAWEYLESLNPETSGDLEVIEVYGRYLGTEQRFAEAMAFLEPTIERPEAPESVHGLYLSLSQASGDPALFRKGLDHVIALARRPDAIGLKALRLLIPLPGKTGEQFAFIDSRVKEHPLVERNDRLRWVQQQLARGGVDAGVVVDSLQTQFDLNNPEDLAEFARWLNQNGLAGRVESILTLDRALTRKDLFLILMDSYAFQGKWETIQRVLEGGEVPLERYLSHIFLARTYLETGSERRAKLGWQRVRLEVANDANKLQVYAQYTRKLGLYDEARLAYERLAELPIGQRPGLEQRLEMERQLQNTKGIAETLEAMAAAYPQNDPVKNDLAYIRLLRNERVAESVQAARELIEKYPTFFSHKITLALGLFRKRNPAEALQVFEGFTVPYQELSASWRVVFGSILRANDQHDLADSVFRGIDARLLLEEELELFERYGPRPREDS
jgi:tetratricopeptide (TPR) repeat protein